MQLAVALRKYCLARTFHGTGNKRLFASAFWFYFHTFWLYLWLWVTCATLNQFGKSNDFLKRIFRVSTYIVMSCIVPAVMTDCDVAVNVGQLDAVGYTFFVGCKVDPGFHCSAGHWSFSTFWTACPPSSAWRDHETWANFWVAKIWVTVINGVKCPCRTWILLDNAGQKSETAANSIIPKLV